MEWRWGEAVMSNIYLDSKTARNALDQYRKQRQDLAGYILSLQGVKFAGVLSGRSFAGIYRTLEQVIQNIDDHKESMGNLGNGLSDILETYADCETKLTDSIKSSAFTEVTADDGQVIFDSIAELIPAILHLLFPFLVITKPISILLINSHAGDYLKSSSVSASIGGPGYSIDEDGLGVTGWIGKASAEAKNDYAYAGVNGYLGKASADVSGDASFWKNVTKWEYEDGEWQEKEEFSIFNISGKAEAGASAASGDAQAGVGDDMLGVEGSAEGSVLNANAGAEGELSLGEDGPNAYAGGKAMISAAEGKASGTVNVLGIEITGEVGGYAGALGAEGKIGIEDGKLVIKGGAAAALGLSAGIEIGLNEEGWDNFVDFIVFWD